MSHEPESSSLSTSRVVAITGAAGGIGLATAQAFVDDGAIVVGLDLSEGPPIPGVRWHACDVTDPESVEAAFDWVKTALGRLDVVVNNAGITARGSIETATEQEWKDVFDVNVFSVARVTRHALPLLRQSESASIVNVASVNAIAGTPMRAVYTASKGAVAALTRSMAADLIRDRIRVNSLHPGPVLTDGTARHDPDREAAIERMKASQPLGHMIAAKEIAEAVVYLARPGNRSLTGAELVYDGSHIEVVDVGTGQ